MSRSYDEVDSDLEIADHNNQDDESEDDGKPNTFEKEKLKQFAQRGINDEAQILKRLSEIRANFYNRLESRRIIKKQGRIPFTEHMTISKY